MSIAKRLYLMLLAALLGLLLVGGVGFFKMSKVFDVTNQGNAKTVPGLLIVSKAVDEFGQLRAHITQHVLSVDDKGKAEIEKQIRADRERINGLIKDYEPLATDAGDRKLLDSLRANLDAYFKGVSKTLELSGVNLFDEARSEIILNAPNEARLRDAFGALMKLSESQALKVAQEGQSEISSATWASLGITVLVALVVGTMGTMITRTLIQQLKLAADVANTVAAGDLTSRIEVTSSDETGKMIQALKEMNEGLIRIVAGVRGGTDGIAIASTQIATGNLDLSARTEQQASSLQETASAMEGLTASAKQNADNARQANQLAASASEVAGKGGVVVSQVVDTMESINKSSKRIIDIIGVIDGIAFQTNILALNAAVEAARAGEQGRGFAVVAAEVRSLAQRSANAAKEIKALIADSVQKVDDGAKLVDQAGATMQEIVESFSRVTAIMGKITVASQEQTNGIEQINRTITDMDHATQQNATLVEEAAAASEAMRDQAGQLAQLVSVFKLSATDTAAVSGPGDSSFSAPRSIRPPDARQLSRRRSVTLDKRLGKQPALATGNDDWTEF